MIEHVRETTLSAYPLLQGIGPEQQCGSLGPRCRGQPAWLSPWAMALAEFCPDSHAFPFADVQRTSCIKPALRSWEKAHCVRDYLLPACGVHELGSPPRPLPLTAVPQKVPEGGVGAEAQEAQEWHEEGGLKTQQPQE
eukprot:scaffold297014_cov22-Tisochrysis_lutea.AAC.1